MRINHLRRLAPLCGVLLIGAMPLFASPQKRADNPPAPPAAASQQSPEELEARHLAAEVNRMSANLAASIRSVDTKFRISPTRNASGTATTGTWPDEAITASLTPAEFQWFRVHGGATWMRQVIRRDMQSQAGRANRITPGSDLSVPDGMHVVYVAPGATQ